MDLLSICRTMWKHKLVVLPVLLITFVSAAYFLVVAKPLYQTTADYVIAPPPTAATPAQIAADPSLKNANPANLYARFYDQSIIADALEARMTSPSTQNALLKQGADPRNTTTLVQVNGTTEPGVEVTGTGSTAAEATRTGILLGDQVNQSLRSLQSAQGTNPFYMFTAIQVANSGPPQVKESSKLRSVLGVLGIGIVLLFLAVSIADAIDKKRAERRHRTVHRVKGEIPGTGAQKRSASNREPAFANTAVVSHNGSGDASRTADRYS